MPANLAAASPSGVFPQFSYTAYKESRTYPILFQGQHDGTVITSLIQDGVNTPVSVRTWAVTLRLTSPNLVTLRTFYESQNGPLGRFWFYDPFYNSDIGSCYDPTGESVTGRYTCMFLTQMWTESTDMSSMGNTTSLSFQAVA